MKPKSFTLRRSRQTPQKSSAVPKQHQYSRHTKGKKRDLLLSFPMGGSCGSCRPLRPDMGVLVGLVCTEPLRGCALRDKQWADRRVRRWRGGDSWEWMQGLAMSHPHLREAHMYYATNQDEREQAASLGALP